MSTNERKSEFYADDKDLQDLLKSNRRVMTKGRLLSLARSRGLILSEQDPREELVEYLSILPHTWPEIADLLDSVSSADREPTRTAETYEVKASLDEIEEAIEAVKKTRDTLGEGLTFTRANGVTRVRVDFTEMDPSKARLRQRKQRFIEIEFAPSNETMVVRLHQADKAREVCTEVIEELARIKKEAMTARRIELVGVTDPGERTQFFARLIKGLPGFGQVIDVDRVDVSRFPPSDPAEDTNEDGEEDDDDTGDSTDEDEEKKGVAQALAQRVLLSGGSLLGTDEYKQLRDAGFFIGNVRWRVARDTGDPFHAVLEAGFDKPVEGVNFGFKVCGVFRKSTRNDELAATRQPPNAAERRDLTRAIEASAQLALPTGDDDGEGA